MRVFLDSNILVAAFMWPTGLSAKIIDHLVNHDTSRCILGQYIIEETRGKLAQKFGVPSALIDPFITELLHAPHTEWQTIPLFPPPFPVLDPKDRLVITSALAAQADILVTEDKLLLRAGQQTRAIQMMNAADFWGHLQKAS